MAKLTEKQMASLDKTLPSAGLISAALTYELGRVGAEKIWENYPDNLERAMEKVGRRMRAWLVNPPRGKYSFTA